MKMIYMNIGLKNRDKRKHAIAAAHVDVILKFLPFLVPFPSSAVDLLTCPSDSYHQLIHTRTLITANKSKQILLPRSNAAFKSTHEAAGARW